MKTTEGIFTPSAARRIITIYASNGSDLTNFSKTSPMLSRSSPPVLSSVEVIAYAPPVIMIALPVSNMQAATTPVLPKNACTSGREKQPML